MKILLLVTALLPASVRFACAQQWQHLEALPAGYASALFGGDDKFYAAIGERIYYTATDGSQWDSSAVVPYAFNFIPALHVADGHIFVGTSVNGVFSSTNLGQSWQSDNAGLNGLGALSIAGFAQRGDSLYVATQGAKVFVKKISTNSAWSAYSTGLPWHNIESITHMDGVLYAGAGANATVSRQQYPGHAWTEHAFDQFNGEISMFLGVIRSGETLLAAGSGGLYRNTDNGFHWTHYNPGTGLLGAARFVKTGNRVIALLVKPSGLSFIQYTDNEGLSWHNFAPVLSGSAGYDLAFFNGQLYAGRSNGLWRLSLTTRAEEPNRSRFQIGQNFPNPFSNGTTIPVTLQEQSLLEVTVFDPAGRIVQTLWRGEKPPGAHHFEWDAAGLPAGIYFYRITVSGQTETRRMLVIH
ncbi:MAG: T9SS type A sorting domain-containing protein [Saprospiraceae bacterium]|nr:T9SS type A sorting domain-containing protein [Saprospiraceae bacterium]